MKLWPINKTIFGLFAVVTALSACEGSLVGKKQTAVVVGGKEFTVVTFNDHWAAWWNTNRIITAMPPLTMLKPLQIQAIEQVSGCKVVGTEYVPGAMQPAYMQASVEC